MGYYLVSQGSHVSQEIRGGWGRRSFEMESRYYRTEVALTFENEISTGICFSYFLTVRKVFGFGEVRKDGWRGGTGLVGSQIYGN